MSKNPIQVFHPDGLPSKQLCLSLILLNLKTENQMNITEFPCLRITFTRKL